MPGLLRVGTALPEIRTGDCDYNAGAVIQAAFEASKAGVGVLVLPGLALTGVGCGHLYGGAVLRDGEAAALKRVLAETAALDISIITSVYNEVGSVHKQRPIVINRGMASTPSDSGGLNIILSPEPAEAGQAIRYAEAMRAASRQNDNPFILVTNGSSETVADGVYSGYSLICHKGETLAEHPAFSQETVLLTADVTALGNSGISVMTALPDIFKLYPQPNVLSKNPFFPDNNKDYPAFCADILAIQQTALARRIGQMGAKKAVINVSGGLDSTLALLALALAMDRLGRSRADIIGISLPGFGTTARTNGNGNRLMAALGVANREIDIKPACLRHFADIGLDPSDRSITYENVQARERTQIALDVANMENGVMIGTGDMSEAALGFTTFGGDHLSMYNPNGGVTKTAVRETIRYAAENGLFGVAASDVLFDILDTPVSPELLPPIGETPQLTEKLVGPYELHDFFLYYLIKEGLPPHTVRNMALAAFDGDYDGETVGRWLELFIRRFISNAHKRSCTPEGPKALSLSLSPRNGFQMPGDCYPEQWLKGLNR